MKSVYDSVLCVFFIPFLEQFEVLDHNLWRVQELAILPPTLCRLHLKDNTIPKELVLVPKGPILSMDKLNALKAPSHSPY